MGVRIEWLGHLFIIQDLLPPCFGFERRISWIHYLLQFLKMSVGWDVTSGSSGQLITDPPLTPPPRRNSAYWARSSRSPTHTFGRTVVDEWSACHRDLYLTIHKTHDRHTCPGGIRTHNPSKRGATYPRLKPRGHWGWLMTDDFQFDIHIHHKTGLHNTVSDLVRTTLWQSAIIISRSVFSVEIFCDDWYECRGRARRIDVLHWSPEIISNNFSNK
jgi:hypothetical protein